jgi:hypothetical protein
MKRLGKMSLISVCLLIFLCSLTFPQSVETGAIQGTVMTPEGEVLPGVEVTLTSPAIIGGDRIRVTDQSGRFRFPALPVGNYEAEARLEGFTPQRRVDLRVSIGMTLTVDFTLAIGSLEEQVTVVAESPMIDVKDSQLSTSILEKEFMQHLPSPRSMRRMMTFAPSSVGERGATPYGAPESLSSNFLIDGVKINSPEAGEPEVNLDFDSIEEIKMMGQGTNAEYDGFQGITVSTITKSGGNQVEGLGTFWFQLPGFHSDNWGNFLDEDGELYLYDRTWDSEYDFHINLGGPFMQDKLWWYVSGKYVRFKQEIQPGAGEPAWEWDTEVGWDYRTLAKLTWQVGGNDRVFGTFEYSKGFVDNIEAGPWATPEATADEGGRQVYYNLNFLHLFSDRTFFDLKVGGYDSHFEMNGKGGDNPAHYDIATDVISGNFWEFWHGDRSRTQVNTAVSHHVDDFMGSHDFKFGGEYENSYMRNYRGYHGGRFYEDYYGEPYFSFYTSPYHIEPTTKRTGIFLQDQWIVSDRISINPGIRINFWRGSTPRDGTIFKPKTGIAPRLGITFDLLGDHTTALKLHYGKYYHGVMGMWFGHWSKRVVIEEFLWGPFYDEEFELPEGTHGEEFVSLGRDVQEESFGVDPNLKFPYLHNLVVGIERELGRDISVGVSYIYRTHKDFISNVNLTGMWEPYAWTEPITGETFNIWKRLNPYDNERYVTNPYEGQGRDIGAAFEDIVPYTPTRKYWGLEFTFRKRFSDRWQFHAAYTYSSATGSDDNGWGEYEDGRISTLGSSIKFLNPNWAYNAEGTLTRDHPHILKLMGSYVLPGQITFGAYFSYTSARTYNRQFRVPSDIDPDAVAPWPTLRIYGEEKGSFRYPSLTNLDIRLEKFFTWGERIRIGFLIDMFNVLNVDTVDSLETRIERGRDPFQYPRGIVNPRTFRLGVHFEF